MYGAKQHYIRQIKQIVKVYDIDLLIVLFERHMTDTDWMTAYKSSFILLPYVDITFAFFSVD